ncbi:MAG: DUF1015 domain-containing protein [Planctomycetota bacterium]
MEIRPFKAYRFDGSVVGDVGNCIAPPYDVIDAEMQQRLYERSEYNVVRIIKGKSLPGDTQDENQYTRAAGFLNTLIETAALRPDPTESFYAYVQDFTIGSAAFCRSSLVALAKLARFGKGVQPHEKTLDGPKADRLKLMRAKAAQFGQIFMLYDDPEKTADSIMAKSREGPAAIDFTDDNSVRHRLFVIDDAESIAEIVEMMKDKTLIIADGHHRYETALNYYRETQNPAAAYRMMTIVNMRNEGLIILPTHRLVSNIAGFSIDKVISQIEDAFEITRYSFTGGDEKISAKQKMFDGMKSEFEKSDHAFGIYAGGKVFYLAVLRATGVMESAQPEASAAARSLDVNVLHKLILENVLGIGAKQLASQSNIEYIKDIGDAIDKTINKVDSGRSQAVFFMNPTRIEQVRAVAAAGEKMPQKSTFFYPKIYTGLVINKL